MYPPDKYFSKIMYSRYIFLFFFFFIYFVHIFYIWLSSPVLSVLVWSITILMFQAGLKKETSITIGHVIIIDLGKGIYHNSDLGKWIYGSNFSIIASAGKNYKMINRCNILQSFTFQLHHWGVLNLYGHELMQLNKTQTCGPQLMANSMHEYWWVLIRTSCTDCVIQMQVHNQELMKMSGNDKVGTRELFVN